MYLKLTFTSTKDSKTLGVGVQTLGVIYKHKDYF